MSESKATEIIEILLGDRERDFEKRVVPAFLKKLGYTDIELEPKLGDLRADFLVRHEGQAFYIEASSPSLDKKGIFDPETMLYAELLEEIISRKFEKELPKEFQDCFLEGSCDGLVQGESSLRSLVEQILNDIRPWKDRIADLPTYTSEPSIAYRRYETFPKEFSGRILRVFHSVPIWCANGTEQRRARKRTAVDVEMEALASA